MINMSMEETYHVQNPWWEGRSWESGVPREFYVEKLLALLGRKRVGVVMGSRRVGKTTIMRQLVGRVLERSVPPDTVIYLELDHPHLVATPILDHLRNLRRMLRHPRDRRLHLFLDEVQDSPDWERQIKAVAGGEEAGVVVTGSTSALLGMQGGKLTGRQIVLTVHPLGFGEFLKFRKKSVSASESYLGEALVEDYLETGGYPEQVLSPSEGCMRSLVDDILARDILRRFAPRKPAVLHDLLLQLAASVGSRTSFSRLGRVLGIDADTVKEYIGFMESAFLVKLLAKWTTSHSERAYAPKKVYLVDTGVKSSLTGKGDMGFKAENAVFMELLRCGREAGYHVQDQKEVDFVVGRGPAPAAVEVKYESRFDWRDGKYRALRSFLKRNPKTRRVVVVTRGAEASARENGTDVAAVPLWKFLLEGADAHL
jgi:predicted AAA+ superfamily ATPase